MKRFRILAAVAWAAAMMVQAAEEPALAPLLQKALREQTEAGKVQEFEWERIKGIAGPLSYLGEEAFLAAVRPMAADEAVPVELRADALAGLLAVWGGSHDSEGACPSRRQLAMVDQLLPLFPQAAQKAVVARGSLTRASGEYPDVALKWLRAHPELWQGEEREKLVEEMLQGWGVFSGESPTLAEVEALGVQDYRLAGRVLARDGEPPQAIARMRELTASMIDKDRATALRQGMVEGAGASLPWMEHAAALKWLESAGLSEAEVRSMAEAVDLDSADHEDLNEWIGWLAGKLPPQQWTAKLEAMGERWQDMPWALEELGKISLPTAKAAAVRGFCRGEKNPELVKAAESLLERGALEK